MGPSEDNLSIAEGTLRRIVRNYEVDGANYLETALLKRGLAALQRDVISWRQHGEQRRFAQDISDELVRRGISQKKVAEQLGEREPVVSQWLNLGTMPGRKQTFLVNHVGLKNCYRQDLYSTHGYCTAISELRAFAAKEIPAEARAHLGIPDSCLTTSTQFESNPGPRRSKSKKKLITYNSEPELRHRDFAILWHTFHDPQLAKAWDDRKWAQLDSSIQLISTKLRSARFPDAELSSEILLTRGIIASLVIAWELWYSITMLLSPRFNNAPAVPSRVLLGTEVRKKW